MSITGISSNYSSVNELVGLNSSQRNEELQETEKKRERPSIETMVSQFQAKLGLNDNQMIDLKKIFQKSFSAMDEEMKSNQTQNFDPKTMHSKMKANMDKMNEDINGILTDEQKTAFSKFLEERNPKIEA
jgi:hypothetical protein